MSLQEDAFHCLCIKNPSRKVLEVQDLYQRNLTQVSSLQCQNAFIPDEELIPGFPDKPELVPPLAVKKRAMHTIEGRAVAIHALAHIEFNAINLALDAIWRFSNMPTKFYRDWLLVAKEESEHFDLLQGHLAELGYFYGDFTAHNSLWEMVDKTKLDVLARMALVPRTMEARGLDAVPMIRDRFLQVKDMRMVEILDIILRDEIGHVEIGNYWFNYLCQARRLDPMRAFKDLCKQYKAPILRGPFNIDARKLAGFTDEELTHLVNQAS
jgi:uncharacterized ferritin-like protein (DUF455 family)